MLLTYVDESYSKSCYFVAGVAVHHDAIRSLEDALNAVAARAVDEWNLASGNPELHGYPLFQGEDDWSALKPRQRIAVYGWAFDAIAAHDVRVFLEGVDSVRLRRRYKNPRDPHDVCLQHLLEQVNRHADRTNQVAMIIADELHEHDRRRADLRGYKSAGTPGYLSSRLPRIVDTIHFAPSHHSRLIQAADLVAFLHHRRVTVQEQDPRAARANEALWNRIHPRVTHSRLWTP